ncbi:hypothetical protein DFQ29_007499 [Apophysomyces sp. BC1021]|nr:hypothetical protein DFQ29_007499 [Apophysomyces sp. BC1021]
MSDIKPFVIPSFTAEQEKLLREKLGNAVYPNELQEDVGWSCGAPGWAVRPLVQEWLNFDWEIVRDEMNQWHHYHTDIDGSQIHFVHEPSDVKDAIPIVLMHGWPSSFYEFHKLIEPLRDGLHGNQAFHVVVPSLPGFGFSEPPKTRGYGVAKMGFIINSLMVKLGYSKYVWHGGDWGGIIGKFVASKYHQNCRAFHTNLPMVVPPLPTPRNVLLHPLKLAKFFGSLLIGFDRVYGSTKLGGPTFANAELNNDCGYRAIQGTRPYTLSYGLTDSPMALLAWMLEKYHDWTYHAPGQDSAKQALPATISSHEFLTQVSIYYLTNTMSSSIRIYYECLQQREMYKVIFPRVDVPVAVCTFPNEITKRENTRDLMQRPTKGIHQVYKFADVFAMIATTPSFFILMRLSVIIATAAVLAEVSLAQYTHQLDWISRHLSNKSPYPIPAQLDNITTEYTVNQIQLVVRHGTRYAKAKHMQKVNKVLERLHKSDNVSALSWLQDYKPMDLNFEAMLDRTGQLDEYLHGQRVAKVQSKFLDSMIQKDVVFDLSSYSDWSPRTSESGLAFHQGLLQGRGPLGSSKQLAVPFYTLDPKTDNIINLKNNCPLWQEEVNDGPIKKAEAKIYADNVLAAIAQRLSNDLGIKVKTKNVDSIFTGCTFDVAQHRNTKSFCSLLSHDEILQLEYYRDLKSYYKYSYGYPELNTKVACELGQVLHQELQDAYNNKDGYYKLSLKFGHTQTILFLQSYLGLFKDPFVLRANTSQADIDRRVFRTSNISPFATSIGFQLLTKKGTSDKYVRVLVAERPVVMPGCGTEICPYAKFESVMKPLLQFHLLEDNREYDELRKE